MSMDLGLHRNHRLYRPAIGEEELEDSTRAFCGGKSLLLLTCYDQN